MLEKIADVKMVGMALAKGWLDGFEDRRRKAVHDLLDVVENSFDDEMKIKAFSALVRADVADLKRQEVALKKQALDDERRLRLLEIARHLPPGELARLASSHGYAIEAGRKDSISGTDGKEASGGAGSQDTNSERGQPQT